MVASSLAQRNLRLGEEDNGMVYLLAARELYPLPDSGNPPGREQVLHRCGHRRRDQIYIWEALQRREAVIPVPPFVKPADYRSDHRRDLGLRQAL